MTSNRSDSESGFTLVETLVSLLILAISSGLLVQSISLASSQITSARRLLDAEQTALLILAEQSNLLGSDPRKEGVDQLTDLYWNYSAQVIARNNENEDLASIEKVTIEVSLKRGSPTIFRLKTLTDKRQMP
jgi:prepilin-type N-terminal cleavage/methylation domain-containing protein